MTATHSPTTPTPPPFPIENVSQWVVFGLFVGAAAAYGKWWSR